MTHAMAHCQSTRDIAHLWPSSLLMEATAATQGVYSRLKTSMDAADRAPISVTPPTKRVSMTDTTLSLAIKPQTRDVMIRQSPRPTGRISGTRRPDRAASILSWELSTRLKPKSKLFKNQTTMVAIRMTEKALCRKSRDFSQSSMPTFLGLGKR